MSNRQSLRLALVVVASLAVAACGGADTLDRVEAIAALETTGVTTAEATCVADSLAILGELDAADPRIDRGPSERDALVTAMNRCVGSQPETEVAGLQLEIEPAASSSLDAFAIENVTNGEEPETESELSAITAEDESEIRDGAIETLVGLGRSTDNASCIVDRIIAAGAPVVVVAVEFGLGLHPLEADAFAACAGTG